MTTQLTQEALSPEGFLRTLSPFDELDAETFANVIASLEVTYVAAGTRILTAGGEPSRYLHVVRKGTALHSTDGVPVLSAEPGEWFGLLSVLEERPPEFDVDAVDDLLLYRLPGDAVRRVARLPSFSERITRDLASRLRAAAAGEHGAPSLVAMAPVSTLISRDLVSLPADADIGTIARTMREHRISSVVLRSDPRSLVTTSDLRDRVLAEDLGPQTPGSQVASQPILAVDATTPVTEAQVAMLERALHHFGVERDGELVAIITTGDLLRHDASSPLHVQRELAVASRTTFEHVPKRLHATVAGLLGTGLSPLEVTRAVSTLTDVLLRRAVELALEDLGPPPAAYAWLTLGSDARREQTLLTDQDHALVYDDDIDAAGAAWFSDLATNVTDQLAAAGLPRCPGGTMAINWAGPLARWRQRFHGWLTEPDVTALYEAGIFLDHRVIAGKLTVSVLDETVRAHRHDQVLLARLAAAAATSRPPIGPLHRLRSAIDGTVDLKTGGINPVVDLARVVAVEIGSTARSTVERLAAAAEHGAISHEGAEELTEAFGLLQGLRLEQQVRAWREQTTPSNRIHLDGLTPTRRRHLKEAFVAIARIQQVTIRRLGGQGIPL